MAKIIHKNFIGIKNANTSPIPKKHIHNGANPRLLRITAPASLLLVYTILKIM